MTSRLESIASENGQRLLLCIEEVGRTAKTSIYLIERLDAQFGTAAFRLRKLLSPPSETRS